jgi:hypothetical protein
MADEAPVTPLNDEARLECIGVEIVTNALLIERRYRNSGEPFEVYFHRRDGEVVSMPVSSLGRLREIIAELRPPEIDVLCGLDEDHDRLLAQIRGELPIYLH